MSFVMFAGCEYFGIMMGDRRGVDANMKIISDTEDKVKQINKDLAICGAGSGSLVHTLWNTLPKQNVTQLTYDSCVKLFSKKCEEIKHTLSSPNNNFGVGVMGKRNGIISFTAFIFENNRMQIEKHTFAHGAPQFAFWLGRGQFGTLDSMYIQEYNKIKLPEIIKFHPDFLLQIFDTVLKEASKTDETINTQYQWATIQGLPAELLW